MISEKAASKAEWHKCKAGPKYYRRENLNVKKARARR